jgi:hypothetical protein
MRSGDQGAAATTFELTQQSQQLFNKCEQRACHLYYGSTHVSGISAAVVQEEPMIWGLIIPPKSSRGKIKYAIQA